MHTKMLIPEFYRNQVILLTGGTGFIGKALIEKLLRSCPGIAKIYLLIRTKKGKTPRERLDQILQDPCFRRLLKEQPEQLDKLEPIQGDSFELNLGLSSKDLDRLRHVSIIIHSAATVRFDDPLRASVFMNTRGTYELLKIAENLPYLKAFVHISTTYSNPAERVIHEKVYEPTVDWRNIINLAENVDSDILDILTAKISENFPNTYTFTKNLAEHIVNEYSKKLPIAIFRPAIVISALKEPLPGWIDNLNGPIATLVTCGLGIKRSDLCEPDVILSMVPIDIVIRGVIVAAYKVGIENSCSKIEKDIDVYNCALDETAPFTIRQLIDTGERLARIMPVENAVWAPGGIMHRYKLFYVLQVLLQQVPFSILLDGLLLLSGKKTKVVKVQRIMINASKALHYFMFNSWTFKTQNFFALDKFVSDEDKEDFGFLLQCYFSYEEFYPELICGLKEFLLKQPRQATAKAKRRMKILIALHNTLQGAFVLWLLHILYRKMIILL